MLLLAISLLAGCRDDAIEPGRDQVRIAALSPAVAVILVDLGLEEQIVARHGWDLILDRELPVAGDQTGLDYEVLVRTRPTHVILEWGSRPLPARLTRLAEQHGWMLKNVSLLTLDDIEEAAEDLHRQLGDGSDWAGSELETRWRSALRQRDTVAQRNSGGVLLLYSTQPPGALGPGSAHQEVLESIGGRSVLEHGGPYLTLDAEDVLRLSPDGIIIIRPRPPGSAPDDPDLDTLRRQLGRIGTLDVPAVRHGRLALIDHPLGQLPSTSLAEIAREMAAILEGWTMAEQEPGPAGGSRPD